MRRALLNRLFNETVITFFMICTYIWGLVYFYSRSGELSSKHKFCDNEDIELIDVEKYRKEIYETYDSIMGIKGQKHRNFKRVVEESHDLECGESVSDFLISMGLPRDQVYSSVSALSSKLDMRFIKAGQEVSVSYECFQNRRGASEKRLLSVEIKPEIAFSLRVFRDKNGKYLCKKIKTTISSEYVRIDGKVRKNIYKDMIKAGADPAVVSEFIKAFSYDVNFQLDLQPGDLFAVLYKEIVDKDSGVRQPCGIMCAKITVSGREYRLYKHRPSGAPKAVFYNQCGVSNQKVFLKTPVDGARLSSRFGKRKHPILSYTKLHKGVDFAAPIGTPIMAAGDGVIEKMCFFGAYGNYILIRHGGGYQTAYAHVSSYAKGMRVGKIVRQGQKIAFIGATGRTTGPHLHFEVLRGGKHIDPTSVKMASLCSLSGKQLLEFREYARRISEIYIRTKPYCE
ncbi:hypothetical protein HYD_4400 [Candidatus Hydrogenosomobacter endosymbioticus]|uniref:M23ase beta-sheet core domain-containing protein n=1 Tax=Candidatus Hydrogenosomobacter endosymbioticus TaxID=2558174 RepID=A0ABM7V949_9PROT|nr:hypothetical protein HYD_4400 [Candidatus Hydrogenosomobacter endosymbioticus]